ncbi:PREDICTED: RING finger protein 17-like isoform X2 [Nicrophorus vespilloides]|uniref:RING finger protein 17-like isoform X2 n=1 Tax=Nicrophorus vespilloides TaxID=110193 RepID=A0ABM1N3A5_NICVS|nr:PREDICTED: RING finger protein 17-like isoform X2 [Nicrophorus vespilloides]
MTNLELFGFQDCSAIARKISVEHDEDHGNIARIFLDAHSKLQMVEWRVVGKLKGCVKGKEEALVKIGNELSCSIEEIKELIDAGGLILEKNVNTQHDVKSMLERMERVLNLGYHLERGGAKGFCLGVRNVNYLDEIDDLLQINFTDDADHAYRLVHRVEEVDESVNLEQEESIYTESTKMADPWKRSYPEQQNRLLGNLGTVSINESDREFVMVTYIVNPDKIFVQMKKHESLINVLHRRLEECALHSELIDKPELNQMYITKYGKKGYPSWCRCRVTQMDVSNLPVVFLIDFGIIYNSKKDDLRNISLELANIPKLAIETKLYGLYPVKQQWDRPVKQLLVDITKGCDVLMIVLARKHILEIDFIAYNDADEYSVRDTLIFLGYAMTFVSEKQPMKIEKIVTKSRFYDRSEYFRILESYSVTISHINSPSDFYVQLLQFRNDLNNLHSMMQEHYTKTKKGYIYTPEVGMPIGVMIRDNVWRRAIVKSIVLGKGSVDAFLVDYGEVLRVHWNNIRRLPESFIALESQANNVALADIEPCGKNWGDAATAYLRKYVNGNEHLMLVIKELSNPLEIGLFEYHISIKKSINALLVKANFAKSTGELSDVVEWPIGCGGNEKKPDEMFISTMLKTVQGFSNDSQSDEDNIDEENMSIKSKPVQVLRVDGPDQIYVKFTENPSELLDLQSFYIKLQKHYGKRDCKTREFWREGDIAVAKNPKDQQIHRVLIKKSGDETSHVFSRDYAVYFDVPNSELQIVEEEFVNVPPFACRCHLYGVKAAGNSWSLTSKDYLSELLLNSNNIHFSKMGDVVQKSTPGVFWIKVLKSESALKRSIFKMSNVNLLLVKNGLAIKYGNWDFQSNENLKPCKDYIEDGRSGKWLEPICLEVESVEGIATNVGDDGTIYFHTVSASVQASEMEKLMQTCLDSEAMVLRNWSVGDRCSVRYHRNNKWYRGILLDIIEDEYRVSMIDYGNVEVVNCDNIRSDVFFVEVPQLANSVKLADVYPRHDTFYVRDLDILHTLIVEKSVLVNYVDTSYHYGIIYQGVINVNDYMISNTTCVAYQMSESDDEDVIILDYDHAEELNYTYPELPPERYILAALINQFDHNKLIFEVTGVDESCSGFNDLCEQLRQEGNSQALIRNPEEGMPCIAVFREDQSWYRASILDVLNEETVRVYFVDFGNVEIITIDNVRKIKPEWMKFPVHQVTATINNMTSFDEELIKSYFNTVQRLEIIERHPLIVNICKSSL